MKLLSPAKFAEATGMHPDTVRGMCRRGEIKATKRQALGANARWRIPESEIDRLAKEGF